MKIEVEDKIIYYINYAWLGGAYDGYIYRLPAFVYNICNIIIIVPLSIHITDNERVN